MNLFEKSSMMLVRVVMTMIMIRIMMTIWIVVTISSSVMTKSVMTKSMMTKSMMRAKSMGAKVSKNLLHKAKCEYYDADQKLHDD